MKKYIYLCIFCMCFMLLFAGCKNKKEEEDTKRNEKVYLSVVTSYDVNGAKQDSTEYDINGNVIKYQVFPLDGNGYYYYTCEYDKYNNLTKKAEYNANGKLTSRLMNIIEDGRYISSTTYDFYGNEIATGKYEYDGNNKLVKYTNTDLDGIVSTHVTYEYDDEMNVTQKTYDKDDNITYEIVNDKDNKLKSYKYYLNGKLVIWFDSEYDEHGRISKTTNYSEDGTAIYHTTYDLDSRGNIIKKYIDYGNSKVELLVENVYSNGTVTGGKSQ